jgi:hypothetical protein
MQSSEEALLVTGKTLIAWFLVALGSLTATKIATYLAIAYTATQLYVTLRDKVFKREVSHGSE